MGKTFDVIVIGVGAMGASTCLHLARRGVRTLGLEQFDIPHHFGSSHGMSRMIRLAYYEHPDYVPLLRRAYELWDELEKLSGQKLLYITGGLYMGEPTCELVSQATRAARQHGLQHTTLDRDQIAAQYPQFELPAHYTGLFEPRAGFLVPERCIAAAARCAMQAGAEIHARERVTQWQSDGSGVTVTTDRAEYRAQQLVVCAGPWSGTLLRDLRVKLVVTRQVMTWFWPGQPDRFELGRLPVWGIDRPSGGLFYGFPMSGEDVGLKVAVHAPGTATDPDRVARDPQPGDVDEVEQFLARHLPSAQGPLVGQRVCLYTNSPDSHFVIDRHPEHDRVSVACGFSGHGFKFASVIGEILADLATKGRTVYPIEFLGTSRFQQRLA
jgi:sarcosine oxidase